MSTRIQLIACSLNELKKCFGSKNSALERDLISNFTDLAEEVDLDDEEIASGKQVIEALIQTGITARDKEEGAAEISVVSALADHVAKAFEDEDSEWTLKEFDDLQHQFEKRLDERTKKLLSYFSSGRNLIGKGFDTDSGWYFYLTNGELKELSGGIEKIHTVASEIVDSGAMNDQDFDSGLVDTLQNLMDTLNAVHKEKVDLLAVVC